MAEGAGAAPVVGQARRVDRQAVGKHIGTRACSVADIGVDAGAVGLAGSEAKPVRGEQIHDANRVRLADLYSSSDPNLACCRTNNFL